jgi:RNA polymerase sigma-70 factor (ECF subfamily)
MIFSLHIKRSDKSDNDLIQDFTCSPDLRILGELYSRYIHLVYGVCMKYLKNRDEAMDASMQIFEKLITEIPRQKIENFRSWLHVVVKNYCLMQLRSEKSKEEKLKDWFSYSVPFMEYEQFLHPVDEDEETKDKKLNDCIEQLKDDQRESIRLFYYSDKCYAEIAVSLNADEKKVKSLLQNARRNLKICLESSNEKE